MESPEELIASHSLYTGRVVNLRVDTVRLSNGHTTVREVVEHRGAVAIVALGDDDAIVMVRQYRRAVEETLLEIPAGTLEPGEAIEQCAHRELEEETGYTANRMELLITQYLAPGYSQEVLHVFLATELRPSHQHTEDDEYVEVVRVPLDEVAPMISDGRIKDAKTIAGTLMALRLLGR